MVRHKKTAPAGIPPELAKQLGALRSRIDAVDDQIVTLLNQRAKLAQEVGHAKNKFKLRAYAPERERQLLETLAKRNEGPLPDDSLRLIYKEIISASLALESPLKVAFLGPEATFCHAAATRHFGSSAQLVSARTIAEVFYEVERGRCEYGVVPLENSSEGVVSHTLDMFARSDLLICAEVVLPIGHHLLTRSGDMSGIRKVYSFPHALAMCRQWLDEHLPDVARVDVESTAVAAELASREAVAAAIASELAASRYGLEIAARNLDDVPGSITRFLVIGHDEPIATGTDRTSLLFALKDNPGSLWQALKPFADAKINMSRIESRRARRKGWDYMFFIDVENHRSHPEMSRALATVSRRCAFMKVLGSYPRGKVGRRA